MTMQNLRAVGDEPGRWQDGFRPSKLLSSERARVLAARESYFACRQHASKMYDFDGRVISGGEGVLATQPLIGQERAAYYVPLRNRRPSAPYRLARVIVSSFTNLIFGEQKFPQFKSSDGDTQDYAQALARAMKMSARMIRARNLGGATGTVGLSWCYLDGLPRLGVHNAKNLFVHAWEDREELVPADVSECYLYPEDEWDPEQRCFVRRSHWFRRRWTKNEDVVYKSVPFRAGEDFPHWEIDPARSAQHNDGLCHFVWVQNKPTEEIDGDPDYEGQYEALDMLDMLLSVITKGAILNLDPTLKLKMDPLIVEREGVRKGSDNSLVVGLTGDASYLELGGTSISAGIALFNQKRSTTLEGCNCVIPDPDKVASQGTSSVAMKMMYAPMLGVGDILREQYGSAMERVLEPMLVVARSASRSRVFVFDADGTPRQERREILLPPRVERSPALDEDGEPTGEEVTRTVERSPGEGEEVEPQWPPYFPPTTQDQQLAVTTLSTATGGQAIMSQQTGTELAASFFNRQQEDEWSRVQQSHKAQEQKQASMFGGHEEGDEGPGGRIAASFGKKPQDPDAPEEGAEEKPPPFKK